MLVALMYIGGKFLDALAGSFTDDLLDQLKGDPARRAFAKALGDAIRSYSELAGRSYIAVALLPKPRFLGISPRFLKAKPGFLGENAVAAELAQVVRFNRAPNTELIGERWKAALKNPPPDIDFTAEAQELLKFVEENLKATPEFIPVFNSKVLDSISDRLTKLSDLTDVKLTGIARSLSGTPAAMQVRNSAALISEMTEGFMGRQFVFDALTSFIESNKYGYFIVYGEPGIGKSAFAAQLVKTHKYVHHFNVRADGSSTAAAFLKNVCAQLINAYQLDYPTVPDDATDNADFLNRLLDEAAAKRNAQPVVIVVDALDEVDNTSGPPGVNPLFLPPTLPVGVYFVVTTQPEKVSLSIKCVRTPFYLEHDSAENTADVREYVKEALADDAMQARMSAYGISETQFIDDLVEKSEGNFAYLHYVMPEIKGGAYQDLELSVLPAGLMNYYDLHWSRMKGSAKDEDAWFTYRLPVVSVLAVANEAISLDLLVLFSGVKERARVSAVIEAWAQFLHQEKVPGEEKVRYRVYNSSFVEFIATKQEVDLRQAHRSIAESLLGDSFSQGAPLPAVTSI